MWRLIFGSHILHSRFSLKVLSIQLSQERQLSSKTSGQRSS